MARRGDPDRGDLRVPKNTPVLGQAPDIDSRESNQHGAPRGPVGVGNKKKSNKLIHRIDAAAADTIITETRKKRAHENVRVLGNDILHDDWREVKQEEFDEARHYTQRILEDFYDDRSTVEALLKSKNRPFTP